MIKYWKDFGDEIAERMQNPLIYPQFVGYFLLCIVLVGALGVHIRIWEFLIYNTAPFLIAREMSTYFIAILSVSIIDIFLSSKIRFKDAFFIYSLILLFIGIILVFLSTQLNPPISYLTAIVGVILSWILWWFANSDNALLTRKPASIDSVTGGSPSKPLQGSTKDFKS